MSNTLLTESQVASFRRDGFLICPDFLDGDTHRTVARWIDEISGWENGENQCAQYRERTEHGPALARTERFLAGHEGLRGLLTTGAVIGAIGQLFDEPAILFKEKVNYKYPGGGSFVAHQDAAAYQPFGSTHITALIAVDPNTVENGCLWFAPGEHRDGVSAVNDRGCLPAELEDRMTWIEAPVEPGGVVFFTSFTPHKSPTNRSDASRRSLYVTYSKASEGDLRDAYYEDRKQSMTSHDAANATASRISRIGHFQGETID